MKREGQRSEGDPEADMQGCGAEGYRFGVRISSVVFREVSINNGHQFRSSLSRGGYVSLVFESRILALFPVPSGCPAVRLPNE